MWQDHQLCGEQTKQRSAKVLGVPLQGRATHAACSIIVNVLWLVLGGDRHETFKDSCGKVVALDLGLFAAELS